MTKVFSILFVMFLVSCGSRENSQIHTPQPEQKKTHYPPVPPPLPPLPGSNFKPIPEAQALEIAKRIGPGDCSDLERIQGLPYPKQYGFDPYYDRIIVHIDSYEQCLLRATANSSLTRVVASYPGEPIKTVGDLAYVLLSHSNKVSGRRCTPQSVIELERQKGASAFYSWLSEPGSREKWHKCLVRKHGT
jgi:hypothetical protein